MVDLRHAAKATDGLVNVLRASASPASAAAHETADREAVAYVAGPAVPELPPRFPVASARLVTTIVDVAAETEHGAVEPVQAVAARLVRQHGGHEEAKGALAPPPRLLLRDETGLLHLGLEMMECQRLDVEPGGIGHERKAAVFLQVIGGNESFRQSRHRPDEGLALRHPFQDADLSAILRELCHEHLAAKATARLQVRIAHGAPRRLRREPSHRIGLQLDEFLPLVSAVGSPATNDLVLPLERDVVGDHAVLPEAVGLVIRPVERGPDDRVGEGAQRLAGTWRILHDVVDAVDPVDTELRNFVALEVAQARHEITFDRTFGDGDCVHIPRGVARALRLERVVGLAFLSRFAAEADAGRRGANASLRGLARA